MTLPIIAALTAAFLALMQTFLMVTVGNRRRASTISFGDGGDADMLRIMRRHGNFIENAPMVLILLSLLEILGGNQTVILGLAILFVVTRISHAVALSSAASPVIFRIVGALGTLISLVGGAGMLAWQASSIM